MSVLHTSGGRTAVRQHGAALRRWRRHSPQQASQARHPSRRQRYSRDRVGEDGADGVGLMLESSDQGTRRHEARAGSASADTRRIRRCAARAHARQACLAFASLTPASAADMGGGVGGGGCGHVEPRGGGKERRMERRRRRGAA